MRSTPFLLTMLLSLLAIDLAAQNCTLTRFPAPLQLFPRDKLDSASVQIAGSISSPGYDSALVEVKKNGAPWRRLSAPLIYGSGNAPFSFAASIHAELAEYSILLSVKQGATTQILASRDSIVCGDVILISGQSNSWPANGLATYVNEYCRGFGRSTGYNPYNPADTAWGLAHGNGYSSYLAHAGVWGLRLAQTIKERYQVPVCIINGGSGGSTIEYNLPNNGNLMDLNTTYGRLLYRATKAGVADRVRAIVWHQGESNSDATWTNYASNFRLLHDAWRRDFLGMEKIYLFQIHQGCGGAYQENLRDVQRRFPDGYPDLEIMSTVGIPGHDGCHYNYEGYNRMAGQLFGQIARDLYGSADTVDINPPTIARAFFTSAAADEIALVFSRSSELRWPADTLGRSMANYFYLDNLFGAVLSGSASHDTIYLRLAAPSDAQTITYLPNVYANNTTTVYEGPWIRNGRGIGALSFAGVPILHPPDAPPVLILPANNQPNNPVDAQFRWNGVRHATWYRFQLAGDSLFGAPIEERSGIADTMLALPGLAPGTRYYWRVRAGNEVRESGWSAIRKFTTAPQIPDAPLLLAPAAGAVDQPLPVQVSWSPAPRGVEYRIQAARDSLFQSILFDQTLTATAAQIPGMDFRRRYFWRVRALNAGGSGPWSEIRSFTTVPEAPPACLLQSPGDHARDIPRDPLLAWHPSPGAGRYHLQAGEDSLFSAATIEDSTITDTFRVASGLDFSRKYFWRIRAINAGGSSPWSDAWDFTTIMQAPAIAIPLEPPDGATGQSVAPALRWRSAPRAAEYQLQLAADSSFSQPLFDIATPDTAAAAPPLPYDTPFFWRVRGLNSGGYGGWSRAFRFRTVMQAPERVLLRLPPSGAVDLPLPLTLVWDPADRASRYDVEIASDSNFIALVRDDSTAGTDLRISSGLLHDARYFWRVRGWNPGGTGDWSGSFSFTTIAILPPAPELLLPLDGALNEPLTTTLRWKSAEGAGNYRLQVARDSNFASIVLEDSAIGGTARAAGPFLESTRYFWRVRAVNRLGAGSWSQIRVFTTQPPLPALPVPIAPADRAAGVGIPARFVWSSAAQAERYRFMLSREYFFNAPDVDSTLRDTTLSIDSLGHATTYYWRVRAENASGAGGWTRIASFMTMPFLPGPPNLLSPPDRSIQTASGIACAWLAAPAADMYRLQLSEDSLFAACFIDDSAIAGTSYLLPSLPSGRSWFWRVCGINAAGAGGWSASRTFGTSGTDAVAGDRAGAPGYALEENRPNPFRGITAFRFTIPKEEFVRVTILSMTGKRIASLAECGYPAGTHSLSWNAASLPAGVYLIRLSAGGVTMTRRVVHLP